VQYIVSLLFASICYFLNTRHVFFNIFLSLFSSFITLFLFCVFCVFALFCVLFLLLYIAVSFLFLYESTDRCHRVENQLQLINIVSYRVIPPPPGATQPIVGVYFTAVYRSLASSRTRLLDHTQRRATVGRTPLNE
jgi:hypothetical protein